MSSTQFMPGGTIHLHRHDLPEGLTLGPVVAVDTETMGLNPHRDRLCLVQLSAGDGHAHLVQLIPPALGGRGYDCPNLSRLLADPATVKLMHFARFDVAMLQHSLGITVAPVRCTKIAARLTRTFTDRHGLKDLCKELLGVDLSKQQQTSDWGAVELTAEQLAYAASDVLHLHALWAKLEALLIREGRHELARGLLRVPARRAPGSTCSATSSPIFLRIDPVTIRNIGTILVSDQPFAVDPRLPPTSKRRRDDSRHPPRIQGTSTSPARCCTPRRPACTRWPPA